MDSNSTVSQMLFFVFGAVIGSFLNVVIHRIPRDKSIVRPGSSCPSCGARIKFYDNIPILSYLILRGRCRGCGQHISLRYPIVELVSGLAFAACLRTTGFSVELPIVLVFVCLLITLSFIDLDFMIIPDVLSLGGLLLGIVLSFFRPFFSFVDALLGVLVGGGLLYIIAKSYELLRKKEGMGGGDIKLLGMIGAFCGIKGVVFSLVVGSFLGTAVGIPLMLLKRANTQYALPFGPFLSFGAVMYAVAGDAIIRGFFALLSKQ